MADALESLSGHSSVEAISEIKIEATSPGNPTAAVQSSSETLALQIRPSETVPVSSFHAEELGTQATFARDPPSLSIITRQSTSGSNHSTLVESPTALANSSPGHDIGGKSRAVAEGDDDRMLGIQWVLPSNNDRYDQPVGPPISSAPLRPVPNRARSSTFSTAGDIDEWLGLANPAGWTEHRTPDGSPYFKSYDGRFITDTHIRRKENLAVICHWKQKLDDMIGELRSKPQQQQRIWPDRWEVYLRAEKNSPCHYYIVSYDHKQVFWLQVLDYFEVAFQLDHSVPESRLNLTLETEFWAHVELFPHTMPSNAAVKLEKMLLYARIDTETAPGSTSPYSSPKCQVFLETLGSLSAFPDTSSTKIHVIARLSRRFSQNRCHTNYGEDGARLDRTQPLRASESPKPCRALRVLFIVLSLVVFGLDAQQLTKIREVVVDDVVLPHLWQAFLTGFVRNVEQSNLIAALIFTANIGFLAITGLTELQNTSSLISTVLSLASLIIGLHHVRQHTGLLTSYAQTGAYYFINAHFSWAEYRILAVLLCLPFTLLIWSALIFVVTIVIYAQQTLTSWGWGVFLATTTILTLVLAYTLCFFWRIWEARGESCWIIRRLAYAGWRMKRIWIRRRELLRHSRVDQYPV